jgi:hypothetical protein
VKKRLAIMAVAVLLGFAGARAGQLTMMDVGASGGQSGGSCDNALDFSQACNSANLGVIL